MRVRCPHPHSIMKNLGIRIPFGSQNAKTLVLISVPNMSWVHKWVTTILLQIVQEELFKRKFRGHIILPTIKPLENCQHMIVMEILNQKYDYWINIDADNPPMKNPLDLILFDKSIIGCPTPVWYYDAKKHGDRPIYWTGYDSVGDEYGEHKTKEGLQRVDAISGGCFCIARRVFEHPDMQNGCFARKVDSNGIVIKGNDISFSERAREAGFELYVHYGCPCRHFSEVELVEVSQAYQGVIEQCLKAT